MRFIKRSFILLIIGVLLITIFTMAQDYAHHTWTANDANVNNGLVPDE